MRRGILLGIGGRSVGGSSGFVAFKVLVCFSTTGLSGEDGFVFFGGILVLLTK
jgi:hypothetical protein